MFRALLKKQLLEVNAWLIQDRKRGGRRSAMGILLFAAVYLFLFGVIGGTFFLEAGFLCAPLVQLGLGWLYFALMGIAAMVLGVIGSVFTTYSTLYRAKDNVLLLSMPIPPRYILTVRLLGVWMWGMIYSALVFVPALICYWLETGAGAAVVVSGLMLLVLIGIAVLTLTCILGWVVAKISLHVKNKSFVTVIASLAFIVAYYALYSRANELLQALLANALTVGDKIRGAAYPLYLMGQAGEGSFAALAPSALMVLAVFALVYIVMSRSFLRMAVGSSGAEKTGGKKAVIRSSSVAAALLHKEFGRFLSSSTYMLNCALGTVVLPAAGIFLLLQAEFIRELIPQFGLDSRTAALIACAVMCMMVSINDTPAPSVSLEGKHLWLIQSLPVPAWQVLKAKLNLHLIITLPAVAVCSVCFILAIRPDALSAMAILILPILFSVLQGAFGLMVNLLSPNLQWTNEVVPIKQSMSVFLAMMGGWALVIALGAVYLLVHSYVSIPVFLALCAAAFGCGICLILRWLKEKGARIFAAL